LALVLKLVLVDIFVEQYSSLNFLNLHAEIILQTFVNSEKLTAAYIPQDVQTVDGVKGREMGWGFRPRVWERRKLPSGGMGRIAQAENDFSAFSA